MYIALLNERIRIQEQAVEADDIGNRMNAWRDYHSCHATVSGCANSTQTGSQAEAAGQIVDNSDMTFTVRYSRKTSGVSLTGFRILFKGEIYDIISIDYMNFKKKSLKFKCRKARR